MRGVLTYFGAHTSMGTALVWAQHPLMCLSCTQVLAVSGMVESKWRTLTPMV